MQTIALLFVLVGCGSEEAAPPPVAIAVEAVATDAPSSMEDVLSENRGVIEQCYRNELRENPKLAGRIEFEWLLENHRVVDGQVVTTSFPEDVDVSTLTTCVLEGSRAWRFPDGDGSIRYPITFSPVS